MYDTILYLLEFRVVRFIGAGGTSTLLYYLIFTPLTYYRGKDDYLTHAVLAFVPSFALGFLLQKYWTFGNQDIEMVYFQLLLFAVMKIGLFGLNQLSLTAFVEYMRLHPLLAQVLTHTWLAVPSYFVTGWILAP